MSYTRFSSPKQARGDSLRRQTEQAEAWCAANGAELDLELRFSDEGISGWSGANAKTGALAALLKMLDEKKIPQGTVLLVESLDRLTRQDLTIAVPLLIQLVNSGLLLVTLQDNKIWSQDSLRDMSDFMLSVLMLGRGHDESQRKSSRVRAAFDAQRNSLSRQAFGSAPGWLERTDKNSPWIVVEQKAESVRKVFALAAQGFGSPAIAKEANREKWVVPTRLGKSTWHSRMAGYIVRNRAVLGEHEYRIRTHEANSEHWEGKATGIVVQDFYPRIVEEAMWHKAQASVNTRVTPRRRDEHYYNIWAGLLHCGHCGGTMQRKMEHRGKSRGQIKCSNSMSGLTDCPTGSIVNTDAALLLKVSVIAAARMGIHEKLGQEATNQLLVNESKLIEVDEASERIAAAIVSTAGLLPALTTKAQALATERAELLASIESLKQRITEVKSDFFNDNYALSVLSVLYEKSDAARKVRADCNNRLRQGVERIWLWPYEVALVKFRGDNAIHVIPVPLKKATQKARYLRIALRGRLRLPDGSTLSKKRKKNSVDK
ncbi:recombinase family protein [Comamonas antarctica]|uniref:recombinase family protein n=1 Tax=Comamonas antarctica TaxID=2743470 RepID=UPI0036F20A79